MADFTASATTFLSRSVSVAFSFISNSVVGDFWKFFLIFFHVIAAVSAAFAPFLTLAVEHLDASEVKLFLLCVLSHSARA